MTKAQLLERLNREMVPSWLYSLEGGIPHDKHCLGRTASGWEVYYSERGRKWDVQEYATEEDACDRLYAQIKETMKHL